MVVHVDGQVTTIENVGEPITVRTGEHGLFIKRGDVVAKAPEVFEVKRGREALVRNVLKISVCAFKLICSLFHFTFQFCIL